MTTVRIRQSTPVHLLLIFLLIYTVFHFFDSLNEYFTLYVNNLNVTNTNIFYIFEPFREKTIWRQ